MRLYKIKLLLQNSKIDSIILFILYADNGTFIVQSRTRLHTKVVRDYLPNSYEITYQTRTRLPTKLVRDWCIKLQHLNNKCATFDDYTVKVEKIVMEHCCFEYRTFFESLPCVFTGLKP